MLLVVTIKAEEGKRYTYAGAVWHRLGASTYRERSPREVFTQAEVDAAVERARETVRAECMRDLNAERSRHGSQMKLIKEDFSNLVGVAKAQTEEMQKVRAEVAGIRRLLFQDILERKKAAEAALAKEQERSWWRCW